MPAVIVLAFARELISDCWTEIIRQYLLEGRIDDALTITDIVEVMFLNALQRSDQWP